MSVPTERDQETKPTERDLLHARLSEKLLFHDQRPGAIAVPVDLSDLRLAVKWLTPRARSPRSITSPENSNEHTG